MLNLPQIRLQSQMAQISIRQAQGKQEIRQPKADVSIEQPNGTLSMQTTPPKLTIDQTQAWEDANLMSTARRVEEAAQDEYPDFLEGMGRRARQGADLMRIENDGNPIIQQAIVNGHDPVKSIGLTYIPSQFAVKINYEPGQVHIDVQTNKPLINATINRPEHEYDPGSVVVNMKQYAKLEIDFVHLFSELV